MNKTYIKIVDDRFYNEYTYCIETMNISKNLDKDKSNVSSLYLMCTDDISRKPTCDLDLQLEICKKIILAYEQGIQETKRDISKKFNQFIGYRED